jgi:hypothetical protein
MCNNECVDTQIDSHHCGNCETQCKTCESCAGGVCGPVECGSGKTCCQDQCVDDCPPGQQRDPATCQCSPCFGQADGTVCGTSEVCCQQACVTNQCTSGKHFDSGSCTCVCDAVGCPNGELQDPDTCQCVNLCATVTCSTCETCDPTSGACEPSTDGTDCGSGNICCQGSCVAGPTCPGVCVGLPMGSPCGPSPYCCSANDQCINPIDVVGYDNHCCLQGEVWCDTLAQCTEPATCCQAMSQGVPCGDTLPGNRPNCCAPSGICCSESVNGSFQHVCEPGPSCP